MTFAANLAVREGSTTKISLLYLFTTVCALGLTLVGIVVYLVLDRSQDRAILQAADQNILRASSISTVTSNEKANPSTIGFYLNEQFAGALTADGSYDRAVEAPPEGPLTIYYINPTDTTFPVDALFPAQRFRITTDTGAVEACTPAIHGETLLWVSRTGSTFFDQNLTNLARSC